MVRDLEICAFGTTTLGSLIEALSVADPKAVVMFDFCGLTPTKVASYRGYYEHLALGWSAEWSDVADGWPTVADLLADLEGALGSGFMAYKGGMYTMMADTPLWVDNWGDSSGTGIVGVEFLGESTVILNTKKVD